MKTHLLFTFPYPLKRPHYHSYLWNSTKSASPLPLGPGLRVTWQSAVNSWGWRTLFDPLPSNFRVLQGSILGPLLFTVCVNDLLSVSKHCKSSGYVDDTKVFLSLPPRDITDASNALNQDLLEISRWCCENSLLINPDKTKLLVIGVPQLLRNLPRLSITIFGKEIEPVSVARDLGVYIDQTLNYNEHISKLVSNCVHKLVQINRMKHLLDRKTLLLMINAFVFSKLFYCSTVWGNTSKSNIKKLQLVQNFAGKIVLGLKKFDHISQGLKSDFLRASRIGRHSRKIDFSFIPPKHTFGWTYLRKSSLRFQRFILRPKFKKVQNLHMMAVFAA